MPVDRASGEALPTTGSSDNPRGTVEIAELPADPTPGSIETVVVTADQLDYSPWINYLGGLTFDNPRDKYQRTMNGVVGYTQTAFYYAQELNNYNHGLANDILALGDYANAVAGDPESSWLLQMAGVSLDELSDLSPTDQLNRVAQGLYDTGMAGWDLATTTVNAASTGGVGRGYPGGYDPVGRAYPGGYDAGAELALDFLANDLNGLGNIGGDSQVAEAIPGLAPIFGAVNVESNQTHREALDLLHRMRVVDSDSFGALSRNLDEQLRSSQIAKYTGVVPFANNALDLLFAIPAAEAGAAGVLAKSVRAAALDAKLNTLGSPLYKGIVEGKFFHYGPFKQGKLGERATLWKRFESTVDPGNYEGLDYYALRKRFGAQVKTLNLTSNRANDPAEFRKLLDRYATELGDFEGTVGKMRRANGKSFTVNSTGIRSRELLLTVGGRLPSMQQLRILSHWAKSAKSLGVNVSIYGGL
jgi:hypothetical protein